MKTEEFNARIDQIIEQIHQLAQEACPDATTFEITYRSVDTAQYGVHEADAFIYTDRPYWRRTSVTGAHWWEGRPYAE